MRKSDDKVGYRCSIQLDYFWCMLSYPTNFVRKLPWVLPQTLYEAQRGHAESSVNGRSPGSPMQACHVRMESGNPRIDVAKIAFDKYLDKKVT